MIGFFYRAYKELSSTEEEISKQASRLRGMGKFLEAHRFEDPELRTAKVFGGGLYVSAAMALADWTRLEPTENDYRIKYILDRLLEIDNEPGDLALATSNLNKLVKMLIVHPPFKVDNNSKVLRSNGWDPDIFLKYLQFSVAEAYQRIRGTAMGLQNFAKAELDPALVDAAVANIIEEGFTGSELEIHLQRAKALRASREESVAEIDDIISHIMGDLIPWPEKGSLQWIKSELVYLEIILEERFFDRWVVDPASNDDFCNGMVQDLHDLFDPANPSHDYFQIDWIMKANEYVNHRLVMANLGLEPRPACFNFLAPDAS